MPGILEKRQTMHKLLEVQEQRNQQLESQLQALEPLANIGLISAMIAHEMNNILTPLGTYAELSLNHPEDLHLNQKTLQKTVKNTGRASRILNSMLAIAKGTPQQKQQCDLNALLDDVFACIARNFEKDGITVDRHIAAGFKVKVEANLFQQVLMNLILNARQAMLEGGGRLTIDVKKPRTQKVEIVITDTGCGIRKEHLDTIFEPFFSTKSDCDGPSGTGLGLTFCKRVIEAHRGTISVDSAQQHGTSFKITLPDT